MMTNLVQAAGAAAVPTRALLWRRALVGGLTVATIAVLVALMARVLGTNGFTPAEVGMLAAFALTTPWIVLGFWNALIGFALLAFADDPIARVNPLAARARPDDPIATRNAVVMAVRNEDSERVFRHIETIQRSLDATGQGAAFDYFVISDTTEPEIAAAEESAVAAWRLRDHHHAGRIFYRRRTDNAGYKAGNVRDFCERWGESYDHMLLLDADSLMSGAAIVRMVRIMQASPKLGILQSLVVGLPSQSFFARVFQFGMRQGMRSYTMGSAWWQGDKGPYWGHNALIRLDAFIAHCELPVLPGSGPLGGHILSHDQVEAVLMARAGYEVRVLPLEDGSWEENPPSLPDFMKRDLRWCHGNMQYFQLLRMPGLAPLSRLQLVLAILMYVSAPAWMAFILFGAIQGWAPAADDAEPFPAHLAYTLFAATITMALGPKVFGIADLLVRRRSRAAYGGAGRVAGGAVVELVFSVLLAPVVSLTQTLFLIGLAFGRAKTWAAQTRDSHYVPLARAARGLWPHLAAGIALPVSLALSVPGALPWATPLVLGFVLAIPFASVTSSPALGRVAARIRLCAIPEEIEAVGEIDRALAKPASNPQALAQAA